MKKKPENLCADRVRLARAARNMTQMDLSVALEDYGVLINRNAIGRLERGLRGVYDYELWALAKVLEVSATWLLLGEGEDQLEKLIKPMPATKE